MSEATNQHPKNSPLEQCLIDFVEKRFEDYSRFRFAEEREWYESALFHQRRQWLKWNDTQKRWTPIAQNPQNPKPMPVSNYFAMTVNANANQLEKVRVGSVPDDDSYETRMASDMAEKAIDAIDEESGFNILRPLLAKHTALWGLGVIKDIYDTSASNGTVDVPTMDIQQTTMVGCMDCQGASDAGPVDPNQPIPCPACGSQNTQPFQKSVPVPGQTKQFTKGRIRSEVRPVFEYFFPRDCQNPNLAKATIQRYRMNLMKAKSYWPNSADDIKADQKLEVHTLYLEALRALVNYNFMHEQSVEGVTVTEFWGDWDELPEKVQKEITGDPEASPEQQQAYQQSQPVDPAEIELMQNAGLYIIYAGGRMLDWGPNPLFDQDTGEVHKPNTFMLWEVDPANVYPKGIAEDLKPLQKRLNRIDSLMELGMMSNAAGKWIWPNTQTGKKPSGSPSEVVDYDPIGDGKIAPQFVQPSPFHQSAFALRQMILSDFERLGLTQGVGQGQQPQGVSSFRGLAYLGAKADELISTQRYLWESANVLRYKKCLLLAKKYWDEPRKVKVAGFNGRFAMQQLTGQNLQGKYTLDFVPNSSRPKTPSEKQTIVASLIEAQVIDITDSQTRDRLMDYANIDDLNYANHIWYTAASRYLDQAKQGQMPQVSPFANVEIVFKVFSEFTGTEEFEALPDPLKMAIVQGTQMMQQQLQMQQAAQAAMQGPATGQPSPEKKLAQGMDKSKNQGPMAGVPGSTISTGQAEHGAMGEGQGLAAALP